MKRRQVLQGIVASCAMLVLILDGQTALQGASQGIELCLKAVIPSLFPFFVLSTLITNSLYGSSLYFLRPITKLCQIPSGAECLLVPAFLGGYPAGAQSIYTACQSENLSRQNAIRMLAFCSNAGPAFLFGMVSPIFPSQWYVWVLWLIHILSAILTALTIPASGNKSVSISSPGEISVSQALSGALRTTALVSGWVILFRIFIAILNRWLLWIFPMEVRVIFIGLIELANGCTELCSINNINLRFLICSGILSFGGGCVIMQTMSVIHDLPIQSYLSGKCKQTLFSLILSAAFLSRQLTPVVLLLTGTFLLQKCKNKSRFHRILHV